MKKSSTGQKCIKPFSQFQLASGTNFSKRCILFVILVFMATGGFAQAPVISYHTPNVFEQDTAITPLTPNNTGGAVPAPAVIKIADHSQLPAGGFSYPSIAVDAAGNIYFPNYPGKNIIKILAGGGSSVMLGSGINVQKGVAVDGAGNVYTIDVVKNEVLEIPVGGSATTVVGTGLNNPQKLALDAAGNIYVANFGGNNIVKFNVGNSTPVIVAAATNLHPYDIALDASNNIYFVNGTNLYEIPAGTANMVLFDKHPETTSQNIAIDAAGNVYLSEQRFINKVPADGTGVVSEEIGTAPFIDNAQFTVTPSGNIIAMAEPNFDLYESTQGNYSISSSLPPGLYFEANTGRITGTPAVASRATDYVVTAHNAAGNSSATVNISVLSSNAVLSNLVVNQPVMQKYHPFWDRYAYYFYNTVAFITITPTALNPKAAITINGIPVKSGSASAPIPLKEGETDLVIAVTALDGVTTKKYYLAANREGPINTYLKQLTLSSGVLSPKLNDTTGAYSASVSNGVTSVTVTPTALDSTATILVNGKTVASGTASMAIPLSVGPNTITTAVTQRFGVNTETYTIKVTRAPSTDYFLSSLAISRGVLSPKFSHLINGYTTTVSYPVTSVTVTPTALRSVSTITVNGTPLASGTTSANIPLSVGPNTITIAVTALDGGVNLYTIAVTRAASPDAFLSGLLLSRGALSPMFSHLTTSYTTQVSPEATYVTVTPTALNPGSTITVNGVAVSSGTASEPIPLLLGYNSITTVVTAPDGVATLTYTVIVDHTDNKLGDAALLSLDISQGVLSPAFSTYITNYTVSVGSDVTSITMTPTAINPHYSPFLISGYILVYSGMPSPEIGLKTGDNTFVIGAYAPNTKTPYTITINRAAAPADAVYQPVSVAPPLESPSLIEDGVNVHEGITPNGDGINDFLVIENITNYPENKLQILNRSGQLIFEAKNYDNSSKVFDGHSNKTGAMQLPGTYFYSLDYTVKGVAKHKTGFIVLKY